MLSHPRSSEDVLNAIKGQTIPQLFAATVRARADSTALRWRPPGEDRWSQWTWSEYADLATRAASGLQELGLERGQRVALMMRNRAEFHPADMAVYLAGGTAFSIYNSSSVEQVAHQLRHSEATIAIVGEPDLLEVVEKARSNAPGLRHVVAVDDPRDGAARVHRWSEVLRRPPVDLEEAAAKVQPSDTATFIYTSGTTGPPKAVMLTHANLCAGVEALVSVLGIDPTGLRMVSYLPMAHIAERLLTHYLAARSGVITHPCRDPSAVTAFLPVVRPELFFGPPRVFEKLCSTMRVAGSSDAASLALRERIGLEQCRVVFTGAAPPPLDVIEFFHHIGLPLNEFYGLSESTGMLSAEVAHPRPGTVGQPIAGCAVRLLDDGEILCRGPMVFAGYFHDPEKTAEALDPDGWLHTGDIGVIEDGYLRVVDRKKELIVTSGGKNIAPANLENALKHIPLVGQACVVGDRRPFVTALLVLDPDVATAWAKERGIEAASMHKLASDPDVRAAVAEGVAAVNDRVSNAERIKRFVVLGDEWLPDSDVLTPTMKLKRRAVLNRYRSEIDTLYGDA